MMAVSERVETRSGSDLIAAERERQVAGEGWSPVHDDRHTAHELALAAACYAAPDHLYMGQLNASGARLEDVWPWEKQADKRDRTLYPSALRIALANQPEVRAARIRELVKAGALIAAEIDRLQRIA